MPTPAPGVVTFGDANNDPTVFMGFHRRGYLINAIPFGGDVELTIISNGHGTLNLYSSISTDLEPNPSGGLPAADFDDLGAISYGSASATSVLVRVRVVRNFLMVALNSYTQDVVPTNGFNIVKIACAAESR